jgi:hypothetical protein
MMMMGVVSCDLTAGKTTEGKERKERGVKILRDEARNKILLILDAPIYASNEFC